MKKTRRQREKGVYLGVSCGANRCRSSNRSPFHVRPSIETEEQGSGLLPALVVQIAIRHLSVVRASRGATIV